MKQSNTLENHFESLEQSKKHYGKDPSKGIIVRCPYEFIREFPFPTDADFKRSIVFLETHFRIISAILLNKIQELR